MKQEIQKSGRVVWVTEWTTEGSTCMHGIPVPYRWVNEQDDEEADSEPEYGGYYCKKCKVARDKARDAVLRKDWSDFEYWQTQTGYGI